MNLKRCIFGVFTLTIARKHSRLLVISLDIRMVGGKAIEELSNYLNVICTTSPYQQKDIHS